MFKKTLAVLAVTSAVLILTIGVALSAPKKSTPVPAEQPKCLTLDQYLSLTQEAGLVPLIGGTNGNAGISIWVQPKEHSFLTVLTNPETKIVCLVGIVKNAQLHPQGAPHLIEEMLGKKV